MYIYMCTHTRMYCEAITCAGALFGACTTDDGDGHR